MSRLADRQYGAAAGSDLYSGTGGGPGVDFSASVQGSASTGSARWSGIIALAAIVLVVVGWHGLKGG